MKKLILTVFGQLWGGDSDYAKYNITEIPTTIQQVKARAGDFESIHDWKVTEIETVITETIIKDWYEDGTFDAFIDD